MRRQWLQGLIEAGINTREMIDSGLARCRQHASPFLPSIGQFIGWCRTAAEELVKLPSEVDARIAMNYELARAPEIRDWTRYHPAVYWVYSRHSSFDWKAMRDKEQRIAFSEAWAEVKKKVREGFDFTAALPKKKTVVVIAEIPATKESGHLHCSSIMSMLN